MAYKGGGNNRSIWEEELQPERAAAAGCQKERRTGPWPGHWGGELGCMLGPADQRAGWVASLVFKETAVKVIY